MNELSKTRVLETLEIMVRIEAPEPRMGRFGRPEAHSVEAGAALQAAVDAVENAVKQVEGVTFVGVGYGIPRRRSI